MLFPPAPLALQRLVSLGEPPPRPRQRRPHGALLDPQHLGDFTVIQPLFLHQQRLAVALGERFEGAARVHRFPAAISGVISTGSSACSRPVRVPPRRAARVAAAGERPALRRRARDCSRRRTPRIARSRSTPVAAPARTSPAPPLPPSRGAEPAREVAHQHRVIVTEETFGVVHGAPAPHGPGQRRTVIRVTPSGASPQEKPCGTGTQESAEHGDSRWRCRQETRWPNLHTSPQAAYPCSVGPFGDTAPSGAAGARRGAGSGRDICRRKIRQRLLVVHHRHPALPLPHHLDESGRQFPIEAGFGARLNVRQHALRIPGLAVRPRVRRARIRRKCARAGSPGGTRG